MLITKIKELAKKAAGKIGKILVYWPFRKSAGWGWTQTQGLSDFSQKRQPQPYREGVHTGNDFAHKGQSPVIRNAIDGVVTACRNFGNRDRGLTVVVHSAQYGITIEYCHMERFFVVVGQKVKSGDPLGIQGNTGFSTKPHCHNEWIIDPTHPFIRDKLLNLEGFDFNDEDRAYAKKWPV